MELFKSILFEDLKIYQESLNNKDYQFCNIISNRITLNACILESKEFVLIGAFLKDSLRNFQKLEEDIEKKAIKTLNNMINYFIDKQENLDNLLIIEKYSEFFDIYRQDFNTNIEIYTENKDYTSIVVEYCLKFLIEELKDNSIPLSQDLLTTGVLNEISRTAQNFGCSSHQIMLQLILSFYSRLRDYFKVLILSDESTEQKWLKVSNEYHKNLIDTLKTYEISDSFINNGVNFLFEIIKEWRFMFMRLMNLTYRPVSEKIKIPSKVEDELKGMVSKVTSQEINGEKRND